MVPVPSLTRTEAQARAALLDVRAYALDLDLTRGDELFGCTSTISFGAEPGGSTFVDVQPAALLSATLNGRPLDVGTLADGRLPLTDLAADNELVVTADMAYSREGQGLHRYVDPGDGNVYTYAQTFLDAAPRMFACFDQPDLKAPYTIAVTAPDAWTVLGNGAARRNGAGPDGGTRWELDTTQPLATYFVTLVAGPYHSVYAEHDGIRLGLHCAASLAPSLDADADELFTVTRQCFDEYHRLFDVRYPFGKYDQCFVPEFNAGAMENPGCVTFRDEFLFRSAVTRSQRQRRAMVVAHEMAHMWFGDLVTMSWWDDLWLNESFAEYLGFRVTEAVTEFTGAWTTFALTRKAAGYAADQRPSTHPIAGDVADTGAALLNFDHISYAKGASALRQLVVWLGDEAFLAGLRQHVTQHAFGNASLADLLAALDGASGRDVTAWAEKWLRTAGVNTLRPEITVGDGTIAEAAIAQTAARTHPTLLPHRIGVGLHDDDAVERLTVEVDGPRTELTALRGRAVPRLLLLNDGDLTFAKVRLDGTSLAALPELLATVDEPLTRALLWGSLWEMVRDAEIEPRAYIDVAVEVLAGEPEVAIVEEVSRKAIDSVAGRFLDSKGRAEALAALAATYRQILADSAPDDPRRLAAFRYLLRCATDVAELRGWLAGSGLPVGVALDPELRWELLYRLTVLGDVAADEVEAAYDADRGPQGERYAYRCRGALPDPAAKAAAWEAMTTDATFSNYAVWELAQGFWQPEQESLTESYVPRYFADLPATAKLRTAQVVGVLALHLYPRYAITESTVEAAVAVLERDDLDPAVRRAVEDATDELRRALAVRALG